MTVHGWHFMPANRVPQSAAPGFPSIEEGATITHDGEVIPCKSGLHFCRRLIDAIRDYCYGPVLSMVECSGLIVDQDNKSACSVRRHVWMRDITRDLHEFAIWCAERALNAAKVTDEPCWSALRTKRAWLDGRATDAELSAARDTAWAAARAAAWDAAWDAARDAARDAAWHAARDAARDAAWHAARDAEITAQSEWWRDRLATLGCPVKAWVA